MTKSTYRWKQYQTPEEAIAANSHRDGACWIWDGPVSKGKRVRSGSPVFRYRGVGNIGWLAVRKYTDPKRRKNLWATCGNSRCIEPSHCTPLALTRGPQKKYFAPGELLAVDPDAVLAVWRKRNALLDELRPIANMSRIAKSFGVSRERIRQILSAEKLDTQDRRKAGTYTRGGQP